MARPGKCSVYLMENSRNGYVKIGISKDPVFREKTLQSQEPEVETLVFSEFSSIAVATQVEEFLHEIHNEKRVRGEWFDLTIKDCMDMANQYILGGESDILQRISDYKKPLIEKKYSQIDIDFDILQLGIIEYIKLNSKHQKIKKGQMSLLSPASKALFNKTWGELVENNVLLENKDKGGSFWVVNNQIFEEN